MIFHVSCLKNRSRSRGWGYVDNTQWMTNLSTFVGALDRQIPRYGGLYCRVCPQLTCEEVWN